MAINKNKNKDGTTSFQVKVRNSFGKWYPTLCFPNLLDAKKYEIELQSKKQKERGRGFSLSDGYITTVSEYWDVWSVENRSNVSDGWKISQNQAYRDYIYPVVGKTLLKDVGASDIMRCLNAGRNKGLQEQTVKHIYSLLRRMFGDAVDYFEMLSVNPVKPRFHRPKVNETERSFLTPVQACRLLEFARTHYAGTAIWLQTLGGMRPESIIALQWNAVGWDLNQILIRRAWKQKVKRMEDYPKGKNWEYNPMILPLKVYLQECWESSAKDPEQLVCHNSSGGQLSYHTYEGVLKLLCRQAGVPEVTPHELRHSCTEIWIQHGASAEDIRRLLNHKSLSVTKRYMHRTDERLTSIGERIGRPALTLIKGNGTSREQNVPSDVPLMEQTNVCESLLATSQLKK